MKLRRIPNRLLFLCLCVVVALLLASEFVVESSAGRLKQATTANTREEAYRANNLGVALLEQFKYKEAAEAFRHALQLDPKLALGHINLAIALYNIPDLPGAQREAQAAIALAPMAPQPHYILGLIAKSQSRSDDAVAPFLEVLKLDPNDVGANVNVGQLYSQQRKYPEAVAAFRLALAAEPYNTTALYNLGTALIRAGQREEGQRVIQRSAIITSNRDAMRKPSLRPVPSPTSLIEIRHPSPLAMAPRTSFPVLPQSPAEPRRRQCWASVFAAAK